LDECTERTVFRSIDGVTRREINEFERDTDWLGASFKNCSRLRECVSINEENV
jgi:hypothetical protein